MEVPPEASRKLINYPLQSLRLVVFWSGIVGERYKLVQAWLERVMLFNVGFKKPWLTHDILKGREHERFLQVVMMANPSSSSSDEEQKVSGVPDVPDVCGLVIDAVNAADHGVMSERHLVRNKSLNARSAVRSAT